MIITITVMMMTMIAAYMVDLIGECSFEHSMKIAVEAAADFCHYV